MAKMLSWETAALRGDGQEDGPVGAAGKELWEGREAELPGRGGGPLRRDLGPSATRSWTASESGPLAATGSSE